MIKLRADIDKNEFYEPSDGCEFDGFYITAAELEQREREAFEAGYRERIYIEQIPDHQRSMYDFKEGLDDYLKQRNREQALSELVADGEKNGDYDDQASQ